MASVIKESSNRVGIVLLYVSVVANSEGLDFTYTGYRGYRMAIRNAI
jgi:hypothetical protein